MRMWKRVYITTFFEKLNSFYNLSDTIYDTFWYFWYLGNCPSLYVFHISLSFLSFLWTITSSCHCLCSISFAWNNSSTQLLNLCTLFSSGLRHFNYMLPWDSTWKIRYIVKLIVNKQTSQLERLSFRQEGKYAGYNHKHILSFFTFHF